MKPCNRPECVGNEKKAHKDEKISDLIGNRCQDFLKV